MITILLIILGAILVPALGILLNNSVHAPEGYEDAGGFHLGKEPGSPVKRRVTSKVRRGQSIARAIDFQIPAA